MLAWGHSMHGCGKCLLRNMKGRDDHFEHLGIDVRIVVK